MVFEGFPHGKIIDIEKGARNYTSDNLPANSVVH